MLKDRKIVIADSSQEMQTYYEKTLADTDYRIVGTADDGHTALGMIQETKPDLIVLEMILPRMDGMELLERIRNKKEIRKKPGAMVVSTVKNEDLIERAFNSGAGYYMLKPLNRELFIKRLDELFDSRMKIAERSFGTSSVILPKEPSQQNGQEERVTQLLLSMSVPAHIKGFQYLRDCILIASERKDSVHSITKALYPTVAKMNHTTTASVERSVRHAIRIAFERAHTESMKEIFEFALDRDSKKPTSAEFIAILSDRIRLT